MIKPIAYYKLVVLCNELKEKHKIKIGATIPRYDCIEYSGEYEGINPFINKKGMFYLNLFLAGEIIKANEKRLSEFVLRNSKYNFTSMYFENPQNPNICYGYPNGKPYLNNGEINPLFKYRNDLYIICVNDDFTEIEIFVFEKAKAFASDFLQKFTEGLFDGEIEEIRGTTKNFFQY